VRFHVWIYRNRPDVQAIVHTHAPHASALAATGKPLKTIHMDGAMLHGCAHLEDWPGVPVADDEGRIISGALGEAKTILLGTAMEELSMVLLTLPVFFPIILHLGYDPVWFGILIVMVVEIGLISPPVGMNLFVLKTLLPGVPTTTVFRGVMPFMAADCVRFALLIAFPPISLYLPSLMK